jgi:hypothetical protein
MDKIVVLSEEDWRLVTQELEAQVAWGSYTSEFNSRVLGIVNSIEDQVMSQ